MSGRDVELQELLERIASGNGEALARFHQITQPLLSSFVRRMVRDEADVEEVLQDLYRYVWVNAAKYKSDRANPMAWLFAIARSRALDSLRRSRRQGNTEPLLDSSAKLDGERQQVQRLESALVRRAFAQLPDEQRFFLRLAFIEGYSHTEIAGRTAMPLGTIKGRIRTALLKLRELLRHEANPVEVPPARAHCKIRRDTVVSQGARRWDSQGRSDLRISPQAACNRSPSAGDALAAPSSLQRFSRIGPQT
jgi:RNA polymerase sigma-70 factor, ECF subfamily